MSYGLNRRWLPAMLLALSLSGAQTLQACAVCYGEPGSPLALGLSWGIASLLAVVMLVLGGIACFFFYLAKRAARLSAASSSPSTTLAASQFPDS